MAAEKGEAPGFGAPDSAEGEGFPAAEVYPEVVEIAADVRFEELRQEIFELLNRSQWDREGYRGIWQRLSIVCPRMTVTCRRLLGQL